MKAHIEIKIRFTIYAIVMFIVVPLIFAAFNWLCLYGFTLFFKLKENIFWLIFWILFFLAGISIILLVRYIAAFISTCVINLFAMICPTWMLMNHKFPERWVAFMCILSILMLFIGYWGDNSRHVFNWWVLGFLLLWVNWAFARDIVKSLKKFNNIRREELFNGTGY